MDTIDNHEPQKIQNRLWFIFSSYFIFFMVLVFLGIYSILSFNRYQEVDDLKRESTSLVKTLNERILNHFTSIRSDLLFLPKLNEMLRFKELNDGDDKEEIEREFLEFAKSKKSYDQIRYIDKSGMELIRINYNNGNPTIVDKESLQNKGDRYYVAESLALKHGEMYASPLDLNKENGAIELPQKPMIRFGLSVFSNTGELKGVVILNCLGGTILNELKAASSNFTGSFDLVNADGYWLSHSDPKLEWGFMYPERSDSKFSNIYPEIWKKTKTNRTIQIEEKDQIITTATVTPLEDSLKSEFVPKWILINTINLNDTAFSEEKFNRDLLLYTLLSAVIIGLITFLLAKAVFQRNNYQRELKHAALYDTLTNLPNRKLLIERATQIIENTVRYDDSYALLFIDLDGFKGVNDTMGHEAGDQLLQIAASKMQRCVRSGDTVARIGGDEFVVLLPRVETSENCLKVAQKILSQICSDFQLKTGKIKIGASIGVIVSRPNNHHTLDEVLKKADELMYEVKKNGKGAIKLYDTENEE